MLIALVLVEIILVIAAVVMALALLPWAAERTFVLRISGLILAAVGTALFVFVTYPRETLLFLGACSVIAGAGWAISWLGQRSIFATGRFRAVLVLLVLAVIAVISVPQIRGWFEVTPPVKVTTKPPESVKSSEPSSTLVPVPSAPAPPPKAESPPPPVAQTPSTPAGPPAVATPRPATPPPAVTTPAPSRPEIPPATAPGKTAEKTKAPERTAAVAPKSTNRQAASGGSYWVQVGAFKESRNAAGLAKTLRSEGFPVQLALVIRNKTLHVVRVGGFPHRSPATAARKELQDKGHAGFVTQPDQGNEPPAEPAPPTPGAPKPAKQKLRQPIGRPARR